jgi:hypothetical protein
MRALSDWATSASASSEAKLPCLLKGYLVSVPYNVLTKFSFGLQSMVFF